MPTTVQSFSLHDYIEAALKLATYTRDEESDFVIAEIPGTPSFFSQGENFEEARDNLKDAIEGIVILSLQFGDPIPELEGYSIEKVAVNA